MLTVACFFAVKLVYSAIAYRTEHILPMTVFDRYKNSLT